MTPSGTIQVFRDRADAGRQLAAGLEHLRSSRPVILGLPRGGVPVAVEVAHALGAPLDVIVVRKLGVPFQPELGMGAVGEGGVVVHDRHVLAAAGVSPGELARVEEMEHREVERRARLFRDDRPPIDLHGRTAIIVDDGVATGGTARAALRIVRARGAARVVLAVPVAPSQTIAELARGTRTSPRRPTTKFARCSTPHAPRATGRLTTKSTSSRSTASSWPVA